MFIQGSLLSDPNALETAQICACSMLLMQAVGDGKAAAWIAFVE